MLKQHTINVLLILLTLLVGTHATIDTMIDMVQPEHMLVIMDKLPASIEQALMGLPDVTMVVNQKTCSLVLSTVRATLAELYLQTNHIPYLYQANEYLSEAPLATVSLNPSAWELDRVDQVNPLINGHGDGLYNPPNYGAGIVILNFDTGVLKEHVLFGGRVVRPSWWKNEDPCIGTQHGTWTAGLSIAEFYGIAQNATIWDIKLPSGTNCLFTVCDAILAITAAINNPPPAPFMASMSWATVSGPSQAINSLVATLRSKGGVIFVAAGNDGLQNGACLQSPSSEPTAFTVAASDEIDSMASFSNYGSCIDGIGAGVNMIGPGSISTTVKVSGSGTSASAPFGAGIGAIVAKECGFVRPVDIENMILKIALHGVVSNIQGTASQLLNLAHLSLYCYKGTVLPQISSTSTSATARTTSRTTFFSSSTTARTTSISSTRASTTTARTSSSTALTSRPLTSTSSSTRVTTSSTIRSTTAPRTSTSRSSSTHLTSSTSPRSLSSSVPVVVSTNKALRCSIF